MADTKRKLRLATVVYWVLLLYIVAALAWWAYSLIQQNEEIYQLRRWALKTSPPPTEVGQIADGIEEDRKRGIYKYVGEGVAFLVLILVGAAFIYRSVRRQFKLQQQQQNFVMAVTHELKTPIAVSRLNLETLQRHQLEEAKREKLLRMTLQETLRLDTLINNILISSQLEDNAYKPSKEELDFSELVRDVVKGFESRYPERSVAATIEPDIELTGDAMLLKLLLSNLLENANKYSPKTAPISLKLQGAKGDVLLSVADEGEGIPDEEKSAVFQKFYRIGNEQTRKTQGTGLGLYICQRIARDHRGEIQIRDNQPTGSTFIVQFQS